MKHYFYYDLALGEMTIAEEDGSLTDLDFGRVDCGGEEKETPLLKKAAAQLREYFAGKRTEFDLPLAPKGTPFQQKDWQALCTIPYGETRSYKDIAIQIGCPKGCRAVGLANNRNPISIVIPCHRVIGSDGSLVGYGGGLDKKVALLELERRPRS